VAIEASGERDEGREAKRYGIGTLAMSSLAASNPPFTASALPCSR
jgi:hypothetical protein